MATQTQYPIRNIRNADELYGKKICKFKWEGGSFYAPMIQTTQLQRTAVVIEHSTVTDMPIAQYGLCKSPTVSLSLFLTDAVPYKTSQLTYNINDVTAKRIIDDLNTIYEQHLPFSVTIPQAFTDYLHDLVITSLNFQTSADKRFLVQADIAATSVNVVKLGYQQGVVATESQSNNNTQGDLVIADITSDDTVISDLNNAAIAYSDNPRGVLSLVPNEYRVDLYNAITDLEPALEKMKFLEYTPLPPLIGKAVSNAADSVLKIKDDLGISYTQQTAEKVSTGETGIATSLYDNSVDKINIATNNLNNLDLSKKTETNTYIHTSAVTMADGSKVYNNVQVDVTADYTNCKAIDVPSPYTQAFVSIFHDGTGGIIDRTIDKYYPNMLSDDEYAKLMAANLGDEYKNLTPTQIAGKLDRDINDNKANAVDIDTVRKDKNSRFYEYYNSTESGKSGKKPTDEEIIQWVNKQQKIPMKNGKPQIITYNEAIVTATAKTTDGKELGSTQMGLLNGDTAAIEIDSFEIKVTDASGQHSYDRTIGGAKLGLTTSNLGDIETYIESTDYVRVMETTSDYMASEK